MDSNDKVIKDTNLPNFLTNAEPAVVTLVTDDFNAFQSHISQQAIKVFQTQQQTFNVN